eukprot:jgi/Mesvir1/13169/Mv06133-RA.1
MALVNVTSFQEFQREIQSSPLVVCHFWAGWCEPCKLMDTILEELHKETPKARFIRVCSTGYLIVVDRIVTSRYRGTLPPVEAEEMSDVVERYSVTAVPYFLFIKNGAVVARLEGASPTALTDTVRKFTGNTLTSGGCGGKCACSGGKGSCGSGQGTCGGGHGHSHGSGGDHGHSHGAGGHGHSHGAGGSCSGDHGAKPSAPDTAFLESLTKRSPVVLFMKGSPDHPQCGFSAKTVAALLKHVSKIDHVNILEDEGVRSCMKEFSKWPTFPQLYVKGEFVGGCDIILEMAASGELAELLKDVESGGADASADEDRLQKKLSGLVSKNKIVLFMKGSPTAPRCKFSKQVVALLDKHGQSYDHVDILEDEEVRQGMKEFSKWPTFPQLYVKGEFIGGCDIMVEMDTSGELAEVLSG